MDEVSKELQLKCQGDMSQAQFRTARVSRGGNDRRYNVVCRAMQDASVRRSRDLKTYRESLEAKDTPGNNEI